MAFACVYATLSPNFWFCGKIMPGVLQKVEGVRIPGVVNKRPLYSVLQTTPLCILRHKLHGKGTTNSSNS